MDLVGANCVVLKMKYLDPFDYVLSFATLGAIISIIEMNEVLRLLILLATFIGITVKTWEQIKKSEHFIHDVKELWRKIRRK